MSETGTLTERHEAQVDARIADAMHREAKADATVARLAKVLERGRTSGYGVDFGYYDALMDEARAVLAQAAAARQAAEREYTGWARAYLVTNPGGHVHRSMHCSTCFDTTDYYWVTDLSGLTDDQVVDEAGERACTVCYPDAPVEKLAQATRVFSADEREANARRDERNAKAAQARAAYVLHPTTGRVLYKTERAATNMIAAELTDLCWYGETHPSAGEWKATIETARAALAAKGVAFDYDAALARARRKVVREITKAAALADGHQYPGYVPINPAEYPKY